MKSYRGRAKNTIRAYYPEVLFSLALMAMCGGLILLFLAGEDAVFRKVQDIKYYDSTNLRQECRYRAHQALHKEWP